MTRVVASGFEAIAESVLRRRRDDDSRPPWRRRGIAVRCGRRVRRRVRACNAVEPIRVAGLVAAAECAAVVVAIAVAAMEAAIGVPIVAVPLVIEAAPIARVALAVPQPFVESVLIGAPLHVAVRVALVAVITRGACRGR